MTKLDIQEGDPIRRIHRNNRVEQSRAHLSMLPIPDDNIVASICCDKPGVSGMQKEPHHLVWRRPKCS